MKQNDFVVEYTPMFNAITRSGREHLQFGNHGWYEPGCCMLNSEFEPVTSIAETRYIYLSSGGMTERCYSVSEDGVTITKIEEE